MILLALLVASYTNYPIVKTGATCPLGYYTQGPYCIPSPYNRSYSIPRVGPCPLGTYRNGSYCTKTTFN